MAWYANPSPTFQPAMRLISAITNAYPAVVTTTFDHDFITGTIVRLHIPLWYGMQQADTLHGAITVLTTDTFSIDLDTRLFDVLTIPAPIPWYYYSYPHVIPIGELNSMLTAAVQNVLPY